MRKRYMVFALLAGLLMSMAAFAAAAQAARPGIQTRIMEQQKRIDRGIASGALTRREAAVLQGNLDKIKMLASNMRARTGGWLTPRQRARLNRMLDRNSELIYNKKHNPARRF